MNLQTWQILLSPKLFFTQITEAMLHFLLDCHCPSLALICTPGWFPGWTNCSLSNSIPWWAFLNPHIFVFVRVSLWFAYLHPVFKHQNPERHTQLLLQPWQFRDFLLFHFLFPASSQTPGCLSHISLWMSDCQLKNNAEKRPSSPLLKECHYWSSRETPLPCLQLYPHDQSYTRNLQIISL